jgi:large subunit ribosomal protein L31
MQADIHPAYAEIQVTCSCGNKFKVGSTLGRDLHVDVCNKCHPFYTGNKRKDSLAGGRVEQFHKRYGKVTKSDKSDSGGSSKTA